MSAVTSSRRVSSRTTDPKTDKERMHLDLETDDVEAKVRRLEALGATRWDHQQERGYDFWVLRDPWANEFCVLQVNFPDLLAQGPVWPDSRRRTGVVAGPNTGIEARAVKNIHT